MNEIKKDELDLAFEMLNMQFPLYLALNSKTDREIIEFYGLLETSLKTRFEGRGEEIDSLICKYKKGCLEVFKIIQVEL